MLDPKFIRNHLEAVRSAIQNKNEKADIDQFLELDAERREILTKVEELKHQRNVVSKEIAQLKKQKQPADDKIEMMRNVGKEISDYDQRLKEIEEKIHHILIWIPNVPHESVPVGQSENDNLFVKSWKEPISLDFTPRPHWEIGEMLGILDLPCAAKITGSNFALFKGWGAKLERALIQFMLDLHTEKHGYLEISPPVVVNRSSMFGTGQLPKLEDDMYLCQVDDLFLIPTAEVPITNIFRDEILTESELPIYYTAYTPCFRREAGSYGAETRGLKRIHQFDKVELVKFTHPETSWDEHEALLTNVESVLQLLEIPYRVLNLCTGDLSFAAAKCYDVELHAVHSGWLEVSSCSNFVDFQARRANVRFRPETGGKPEFVHTLNASGVALPRLVIAILENYQNEDGSVRIPTAIQDYMKVKVLTP